jgi:hypothetical protein
MPSKLKVPRPALPISPKSISSSEGRNRSGSFSSENSLNSQSTVTNSLFHSRHTIYPSESTSTSSSNGSHSTATSGFLSRSYTTSSVKSENSRPQQQRLKKSKVPMVPSLSDYGRSSTEDLLTKKPTGLARRATHIPAPPSAKPSSSTSTLQFPPVRTKSTCVLPPKGRSVSRIGQPLQKRASHIPTPASTRSNSSLGHVSIFASNSNQTKTDYPSRPNTSMATPARSSPSPMYGTRQTNIRTNMRVPTKISSSLGRVSTTKRS